MFLFIRGMFSSVKGRNLIKNNMKTQYNNNILRDLDILYIYIYIKGDLKQNTFNFQFEILNVFLKSQ